MTAPGRLSRQFRRPELRALAAEERRRVLGRVAACGVRCPGCGRRGFEVGDALYLGFLFAAAALDEYRVALTCRNHTCPSPRSGITLHAAEFLTPTADGSTSG